MKIISRILVVAALILTFASCKSYKQIPYLKDSDEFDSENSRIELYDARILPKDLLTIIVSSTEPEAATPFNLTVQTTISAQSRSSYSQPTVQTYLVDNNGEIEFPVLGRLRLGGMTKSEAEQHIIQRLDSYFNEPPIVNVRLVNYKVSVLGEVMRPGTFTVANEKINVFEALALAGDMTIWGKRDNVKLLREDERGKKDIIELDLNQSSVINSPYFYLQQNDVLYVEPNKTKAKNSDIGQSTTILVSMTSILVSLTNLLWNILK